MNEIYNKLLKRALWAAIVLFALRCAISYNEIINDCTVYLLFGFSGEAITATGILYLLYEKFLWRFDKIIDVPVLSKRYKAKMKSQWDGEEREAEIQIKQTLLSLHVILKTEESHSNSVAVSLEKINGEHQLVYTYINKPKSEVRDRSQMHYGSAILYFEENKTVKGTYFTDRNSAGDMMWIPMKDK